MCRRLIQSPHEKYRGFYSIMRAASSEGNRMTDTDETEWPPHLEALVAAPANHRVLLEDDAVRVLDVSVEPGERENLHHHRWPSIMVVLARPNYRNFDANGNEAERSRAREPGSRIGLASTEGG